MCAQCVISFCPTRYPLFLRGECFRGSFDFKDTHILLRHALETVDPSELPNIAQIKS